MKREQILQKTVMLIIGLVICYLIFLSPIIKRFSAMEDFCIDKGFDEKDDYYEYGNGVLVYSYGIECINKSTGEKKMFHVRYDKTHCVKWNKWGDCIKEIGLFY